MSEERLQEIKDSINLQYKVQEANDLHNFNIFTDEEQELVEEVERLKKREQECIDHYLVQCKYASEMEDKYITANNIINEINSIVEYWGYDKEQNDISSFRMVMKSIKDILGSDKE